MVVSQAIDQYKATLPPETPASHLNLLTAFAKYHSDWEAEEVVLEDITAGSIRYFVKHNVGRLPYQPYPTRRMLEYTQVLQGFLLWCAKEGLISEQVPNEIEFPEIDDVDVVEILTDDQIRRLLAACKRKTKEVESIRDTAIILLLLETGISAREICNLTLSDVVLTPETAQIKVVGKGGHSDRQIDLGAKVEAALKHCITAHQHTAPKEEQHLFLSMEFRPLNVEELGEILYTLRDESGIQDVQCRPETFTQTFAVDYMKRGGSILRLSDLLGHTTLRKTENYLQAYPEWVRGKRAFS